LAHEPSRHSVIVQARNPHSPPALQAISLGYFSLGQQRKVTRALQGPKAPQAISRAPAKSALTHTLGLASFCPQGLTFPACYVRKQKRLTTAKLPKEPRKQQVTDSSNSPHHGTAATSPATCEQPASPQACHPPPNALYKETARVSIAASDCARSSSAASCTRSASSNSR
jgi:hypothetical protein